jgi:uncharacterized protein Smg (DUF494 family)
MNYLFNLLYQYMDELDGNFKKASEKLVHDGFTPVEIDAALEWHIGVENIRQIETSNGEFFNPKFRVFDLQERGMFTREALDFLVRQIFLKKMDIVALEDIIDRLRIFGAEEMDLEELKVMLSLELPMDEDVEIKTKIISIH